MSVPDSMPAPTEESNKSPGHHIQHADDSTIRNDGEPSPGLRNSKGWDGKLRVPKNALLANAEALSDPEYSDDENVLPGEELPADEGQFP
jgi:protein phosphatase 1 regulatory subunit 7